MLIFSMSQVMPRSAQKSSISWVSAMPPISEPARRCRQRIRLNAPRGTEQAECAVALEQIEIHVEVVFRGHSIDDEVESFRARVHRVFILGNHDFMRAETLRVGGFAR